MNRLARFICGTTLIALSTAGHCAYSYLGVNLITQQHSNWCWSASSVDVLNWHGQTPSQCSVANWAFGVSDACSAPNTFNWTSSDNSSNYMYNRAGSIQAILAHWGVSSTGYGYSLSWSQLQTEVNASRPFVMRFGWTSGGGHFLVGYGYDNRSGTQQIGYMDPWPGNGYTWSSLSWTQSASDHTWTDTLRTN